TIDNIPGAPGIGDKGSVDLIKRFGTVEQSLERAGEVEKKSYRESLENNRDIVLFSKRMATIDCDVPVDLNPDAMRAGAPDLEALRSLFTELEFTSLLKELLPVSAAVEAGPAPARNIAISASPGTAATISLQAEAGSLLRSALEDDAVPKSIHDYKAAIHSLQPQGITLRGVRHDPMLYSYL